MQILFSDVLLVVIAIIAPPISAAMMTGCSGQLCLSILLTLLGYIPGHLHAFWLIYKKIQADERFGVNGHRYAGGGEYQPIGEAPAPGSYPYAHPQYQQPRIQPQQPSQNVYAGQGPYQQPQPAIAQPDQSIRKDAPPPYGAV